MKCIDCKGKVRAFDKRDLADGMIVWRRYACKNEDCGRRFTTYERVDKGELMSIEPADYKAINDHLNSLESILRRILPHKPGVTSRHNGMPQSILNQKLRDKNCRLPSGNKAEKQT